MDARGPHDALLGGIPVGLTPDWLEVPLLRVEPAQR